MLKMIKIIFVFCFCCLSNSFNTVYETNWSDIFDVLPNPTNWKFNVKNKTIIPIGSNTFTIHILSLQEAEALIKITELYKHGNNKYVESSRSRFMTIDKSFANKLYSRIKHCFPQTVTDDDILYKLYGLNERFRWVKYSKGQKFNMHLDGQREKNETVKSFYTINTYLNDGHTDFEGGRTLFYDYGYQITSFVTAQTGLALIFNHHPDILLHSGEEIFDGIKYLMRTDALYKVT